MSTPTGGWLGPLRSFPRGSSRWSLGLSRLWWKRFTTRVGIRCPRHWLPGKVGDEMDQALLDYSPVVIPTLADPSGEITEALEVLAGDLFEQSSHVGHKLEWHQFFYVRPLTGFRLAITAMNLAMATCHLSHSNEPIWATQQQPMKWVRSCFHPEPT